MKTIEEKARAYDKAFERAKALYAKGASDSLFLEEMFPELKESEGERTRKTLIALVTWAKSYSESGVTGEDAETDVDLELEKEIDSYYGMYRKDGKTYDIEDGEECADWRELFNPYAEIAFARHFYNRGKLNARKEVSHD